MPHMIAWFEIPATDFERARAFYATVLGVPIETVDMHGTTMGMLPMDRDSISGAIVSGDGYVPSRDGALVYLAAGDDLSRALARVTGAGGTILVPKTQISPEFGWFALFLDTEGNKVGLHSPN